MQLRISSPAQLLGLFGLLVLGGCGGGSYSGGTASGNGNSGGNGSTGPFASREQFFSQRVQPSLAFCRSCHIPGGVGDTAEGERFMLSSSSSQDLANLEAAWNRMGGNNPVSRILLMPSDAALQHSAGQPWPVTSVSYQNMALLLQCFEKPAQCLDILNAGGGGAPTPELPLLGAPRGRHVWSQFCEGKPAQTALPTDPRTRILPGIESGTHAVYFNAVWEDCHPEQNPQKQPLTCGEWQDRVTLGRQILDQEALLGPVMTAATFDGLWRAWGESSKPVDFEQRLKDRYGLAAAPYDNPYPRADGSQGQLPWGLVQTKDVQGNYNGEVAMTCAMCHDSQLGDGSQGPGPLRGKGTDNFDFWLLLADTFKTLDPQSLSNGYALILAGWPANSTRGVSNATSAFELLMALRDFDTLDLSPGVKIFPFHSASGDEDTPMWWNLSHKTRKFFEGGISSDSTRGLMPFLTADTGKDGATIKGYEDEFEGVRAYIDSLTSPPWPRAVNAALAEQGAILFHSKNLWAHEGNAQAPRPAGGNGSCASCHGAYSPRYAHDPAYLPSADLIGVAGHIVREDIIGTDPHRARMIVGTEQLRNGWDTLWFGYADLNPDHAAAQAGDPLNEMLNDYPTFAAGTPLADALPSRAVGVCGWQGHTVGYNAPPLHGVWASAPYFHNGSVPTLRQVLRSSERVPVWRRQLNANGGFDTTLDGYDFERLGWKHDALDCGATPGFPYIECDPGVPVVGEWVGQLTALGGEYFWNGHQDIAPLTPYQVEQRKIYSSYRYGASNKGHVFSDVLNDAELSAILEYLKTL
jgi:endo-cleaving rubber dioxygenase